MNSYKKKKKVKSNHKVIVLNHFTASERVFLFKFIFPFMDIDDGVEFLEYCQKHCKIMNTESELLYFWKFMYEREVKEIRSSFIYCRTLEKSYHGKED